MPSAPYYVMRIFGSPIGSMPTIPRWKPEAAGDVLAQESRNEVSRSGFTLREEVRRLGKYLIWWAVKDSNLRPMD